MTDKEVVHQDLSHVEIGIASQQGWRKTQEDAHIWAQLDEKTLLFGVFDGHGGAEVRAAAAPASPTWRFLNVTRSMPLLGRPPTRLLTRPLTLR